MKVQEIVKLFCPPILIKGLSFLRKNSMKFSGDYRTWHEAKEKTSGYDDNAIFNRVREAALKVKKGQATFERDSICFYEEEYRWPVLASLMTIAAENDGQLNILDFGGALGSFYFQHSKFLNHLKLIRWSVIEQPSLVELGKSEFQNEIIKFYLNIEECLQNEKVNVVLLSSVMQYLESPHSILAKLTETNATYILFDRTPVHAGITDKITIQTVPKSIFSASLPMHIFSEKNLDLIMAKFDYVRIVSFPSIERQLGEINFIGILYGKVRKTNELPIM